MFVTGLVVYALDYKNMLLKNMNCNNKNKNEY